MRVLSIILQGALLAGVVSAQTIARINSNKFKSPYNGSSVTAVRGVVTAKGPNGFWMRSTKSDLDPRTSESIYVYGRSTRAAADVGDVIALDGEVEEYRNNDEYLYLTEITNAVNITTISSGQPPEPKVLGQLLLQPPTQQYTPLDRDDVLGVPNEQSRISDVNPTLQPLLFGMDFWESLSGELVTIRNARAVSKPNQFGDTWVVGDWRTTGNNGRGGLTVMDRDANPEAIIIISPLDGTDNPDDTKLGDALDDITGVITYAFGNYAIYPVTALKVTSSREPALPPPTNLKSNGGCNGITVGQYNVENLSPNSDTFDDIAEQITTYLGSPDIVFLQEIQDNSGATDDGNADANQTLSMLVEALQAAGSTVAYDFIDINPVNDQDGGEPGGNIRNAYINPNPGSSTEANQVLAGPHLSLNPGRIDPANAAWENSRVPLVAEWETKDGRNNFFTVNVHWTSKGGGSSLFGDPRRPINGGIDQRQSQAQVTGDFVKQMFGRDRNARVISAGDYNEFAFVQPMETFVQTSGLLDLDDAAGIPKVERYTYVFAQNSQQLDHMHVSPRIASRRPQFEHVHVSSWVSYDDQVSDHDPSVAKLNLCQ
jgi:predicted extracellular nuclease